MAVLRNLKQENELLKAQMAELLRQNRSALKMKVSAKGGVSVYGLGRWPVTLYKGQWDTLLSAVDDIKAFIVANEHSLATKEDRE